MLCHSFGHGVRLARLTIWPNCALNVCPGRKRLMKRVWPGSAWCHRFSKCGRKSKNIGMTQDSFPAWCSVFGLSTRMRPASQSAESRSNGRISLRHREPPNLDNTTMSRHCASGQASSTLLTISRVTKKSRPRLPMTDERILATGFGQWFHVPRYHRKLLGMGDAFPCRVWSESFDFVGPVFLAWVFKYRSNLRK